MQQRIVSEIVCGGPLELKKSAGSAWWSPAASASSSSDRAAPRKNFQTAGKDNLPLHLRLEVENSASRISALTMKGCGYRRLPEPVPLPGGAAGSIR